MAPEVQEDGQQKPSSVAEFRRTSACVIPPDAEETFREAMRYEENSPDYARLMAAGWLDVLKRNPMHTDAQREYDHWMGLIWGTPKNKN